ncbi:MAG: glutamine--fructose-6-phosphate transaminase (isomerizing) [Armatimonadetes bacterium]|nr:glutamine--fructose-6-phosphate transaminase (isomerizing) [Armatimonadota bacterium]
MCGIVGYVGDKTAVPILLNGLKRLEYRGYDSSGIAVLKNGEIADAKTEGKLERLERLLRERPLEATVGIGHTRWATHGRPSDLNAHPHTDCRNTLAVVHNGIIENYLHLKERLESEGHTFKSETDTEILAHLIESNYKGNLFDAVREALKQVQGSYAIGVVSKEEPDRLVAARKDSPLLVGLGYGENFIASDIPAFLSYTRRALGVGNGEVVLLTRDEVRMANLEGKQVFREGFEVLWDAKMAEKGGYKHFMLKEIHEQPKVIMDTLSGRVDPANGAVTLEDLGLDLSPYKKIYIIACGTAYHASMVGKYILEDLAKVPVEVDLASEFRYRDPQVDKSSLVLAVTQSGETADTLAALREAKDKGAAAITICNVVGSSVTREVDGLVYTRAGPEIGVAATKTFTAQLTALFMLAVRMAGERGSLPPEELERLGKELLTLPQKVEATLDEKKSLLQCARQYARCRDFLYLGRHINYPIALEGALKLKEISYIHAEGYAAGEMKHGPIALIDENVPVVALTPRDKVYEKMLSNIKEVKARDAIVIAVAFRGDPDIHKYVDHIFPVSTTDPYFTPLLSVLPLQLLAYYIADRKGCDVDQPRNLAKSVTVE